MMFKNGLFLISVALIIGVVSVDAQKGIYDWLSLITATFLALIGLGLIYLDKHKKKSAK